MGETKTDLYLERLFGQQGGLNRDDVNQLVPNLFHVIDKRLY